MVSSLFAEAVIGGSYTVVIDAARRASGRSIERLNENTGARKRGGKPIAKRKSDVERGKAGKLKKPWMMRVPHQRGPMVVYFRACRRRSQGAYSVAPTGSL
jgi:hypothetical protein